jgi:hypothetical protein
VPFAGSWDDRGGRRASSSLAAASPSLAKVSSFFVSTSDASWTKSKAKRKGEERKKIHQSLSADCVRCEPVEAAKQQQLEPPPWSGAYKVAGLPCAEEEGEVLRPSSPSVPSTSALLTERGDVDGVELGGGEVCAGDEEEAGDKVDAEVAGLDGAAEGLEQPGRVVVVGVARRLATTALHGRHPTPLPLLCLCSSPPPLPLLCSALSDSVLLVREIERERESRVEGERSRGAARMRI